ncbi:MAG: pyridoxamine kinase [Coriobacteriales bacterium]|jgi:pyridoxine kinase|nr:pyridoxamine kinase [Coriobacteriales bacterium]
MSEERSPIKPQKRVISVQDISCVGKCSLTVALPILSACGIETSILPTAVLSTHTGGFTGYTFHDLTSEIEPIVAHWRMLGLRADALYTGYLGSDEQLALMGKFFDEFGGKGTIVMVDPAMADAGKLYPAFDQKFALGMRDLVAKADLTCPNLTEASFMLEKEYPGDQAGDYDQAYIEQMLRDLAALGPKQVVLTGVTFEEGKVGAAAYDAQANSFDYYFTERVEGYYHGTGDIYSSALLGAILNDKSLKEAIKVACDFTLGAIKRTQALGTDPKYGVDFEREIPALIKELGL